MLACTVCVFGLRLLSPVLITWLVVCKLDAEPDLPEAKRSRCAHWLASLSSVETCRVPPWPGAPSPPTSARKWWPAWETAMGASPSTGASKCQVAELAAPDREAVGAHVAPRERATFDVYMPNTDFSRRCPDAISFVLCVCR